MAEQIGPPAHVAAMLDVWRRSGGQHWFQVAGVSMLPTIRDGDQLLVSHDVSCIQPGDVVLFLHNNALVAHRVIRIGDNARDGDRLVFIKGDNRAGFDPPVAERQLVGRVVALRRGDLEIRLDGRRWQIVGRSVALLTASTAGVYSFARLLKQQTFGTVELPGTRQAHRIGTATVATLLRLLGRPN